MIDYSTWLTKFPWVVSVHDRTGRCLYAKPRVKKVKTAAERQRDYRDRLKTRPRQDICLKNRQSKSTISL